MHKFFGRTTASAVALTVAYVVWALMLIYRSSDVGIDGRRYFYLFDDAMISMRFAWNAAHGYGLYSPHVRWDRLDRIERIR